MKVGDLVKLSARAWDGLRVIGPTKKNLWIIFEIENTFNAHGEVTIATIYNGRKKITSNTIYLEKIE
jgi:subtilase family serine protease